jgi:hypothetical protein
LVIMFASNWSFSIHGTVYYVLTRIELGSNDLYNDFFILSIEVNKYLYFWFHIRDLEKCFV